MSTTLTAQPACDVTTIPDADELLRIMDNVSRELARPPEAGVVWELYSGEDGEHVLVAGIRGDRGCRSWADPSELQLPLNGLNAEPVEYFTWDGHQYDQDPRLRGADRDHARGRARVRHHQAAPHLRPMGRRAAVNAGRSPSGAPGGA
ncbi:hypothetical protein [Prauserella flavalba]|uniref:hypothetical protein n=1 Tax=Prauserella flavalba TaxID=1477506 RepID=UPI000D902378|nr:MULTISPECIES: hypothetical protein [Prauserella]PXY16669.1 hypothetical protein BAY59_38250 [Prauserella coralliicola]